MASDVPAVTAAMRIMESLAAAAPAAVSPGQLVNELRLNRSTCYNILAALQRGGWASSRGDRAGWTLGPRLIALANGSAELAMHVAQEELDALSAELGFVTFLSQRGPSGDHVVVAKGERRTGVRVTIGVGDSFPFSAPALMQVVLAWLPAPERDALLARHPLVRFTERTVVEETELRRLLAEVRANGYSTSIQQFNLAQSAVAAPVFDHRGGVDRVVACLAFSSDLRPDNADDVGRLVRACADRITERTGGTVHADVAEALGTA